MNSYFHIHLFRAILRLSSKLVPLNYEQSLKITILYEAELLSITSSSTANIHTTICPSYQQPNSNETQQYKVGLNSFLLIWQLSLALTIIRIKQRNCNCSTPNPYPSQIHPVWVSIIIVKISLLLYSTTLLHPLSIYAIKMNCTAPFRDINLKIFGLCQYSPNLNLELIQINPIGSSN